MKRCCFCSNPEEIVTPKEKRLNNVTRNDIFSSECDGNFYVQEAESTESVIICIHGTRLPSGEETTSSADRSDRSVEGGSELNLTVSLLESRSPLDWSLRQMRILIAKHNATDFTSLSIPSPNGQGHLLKIDPASTGATARRLSRGSSPLKGRGARGGAGAVELGLTLLLISLRRSSKAAGLWYRNRVRKR
ncbi:hypothetical protein T4C_8906 [Trichinella pseudospiralis]|uniref:Uncharacterized protein n=1 Tax=Trichinella pseudospiralis TaxID=6337 RepID=A0A0V1K8N2_TRIPS|nr:hypothetical protein T4C_8906 [Trichinella pseudospiralis]